MEAWIERWLVERVGDAAPVRVEDFGPLPLEGEIVVWHPLDDIHGAPRIPFGARPRVEAVEPSRIEAVVDWFNDELDTFEQLGGERPVQTVEHTDGTRMVVIGSPDGNARVRGGYASTGELVCAVIDA